MLSKFINRVATSKFGGYSKVNKTVQLKSTSKILDKKLSSQSLRSIHLSGKGSLDSINRHSFVEARRSMSSYSSSRIRATKKIPENIPIGGEEGSTQASDVPQQENKAGANGDENVETSGYEHKHEHDHSHQEGVEDGHTHEHNHSLFGHSHSHGHHQPNELLAISADTIKHNPAVRITWIGLLVNIAMAASKGVGGVYFHSQALVADAIHSVSDMFADFLTLATVNVASKVGSSNNYPLGYGKIETLGSLLVSGILLFAGVSVGWSSLLQVFEYTLPSYIYEYVSMIQIGHSHSHSSLGSPSQVAPDHDHGHSHSHLSEAVPESAEISHRPIPNINAAWLAGVSIWIKELLYRKTMKIAEETNSKVLVANAWHHRIDSLTAVVALLTVTGGVLFNVAWLDSIGGLVVSVLIIKAGWGSFRNAFYEIIDKGEGKSSELYSKINDKVNKTLIENEYSEFSIEELSILTAGANSNVFITLSLSEANQYDIKELNVVESKIRSDIKKSDRFVRKVFVQFHDRSESPKSDNSSSHD